MSLTDFEQELLERNELLWAMIKKLLEENRALKVKLAENEAPKPAPAPASEPPPEPPPPRYNCKCGKYWLPSLTHIERVGYWRHRADSCWEVCLCNGKGCNTCEPRGPY